MKNWKWLFNSYENAGVYSVAAVFPKDAVEKAAIQCGLSFQQIDLHKVADKKSLLTAICGALNFPDYLGMNWDALNDCLTDMSWKPSAGYALLFTGLRTFSKSKPEDMHVLREIFSSATQYWKQKKVPFFIVISAN